MICTLHNNKVFYTEEGKGPAVLFMPGPDARPLIWHNQVAELANSFRVLRLDFSELALDSLTTHKCVEIIDEFIMFKELRHVFVVGCSIGGYLACEYALRHPNMVNSVIISSVGITGTIHDTIKHYIPDYKASKGGIYQIIRYILRHKDQAYFLNKFYSMMKSNHHLAAEFSSLAIPLLIINGQDENKDISFLSSSLYSITSNENIEFEVIEGADKLPNVSAPDCYNIILTDFIKRNLKPL